MSESQTESYSPAPNVSKQRSQVTLWLLVLLLALVAFGAALWWAGGVSALGGLWAPVGRLLGLTGTATNSSTQAANPTAPNATPGAKLPPEALQRMFAEQVRSHAALADLVGGRISSFTLGVPVTTETSASVPLTAVYRDGAKVSGTLSFSKFQNTWYFFSLDRSGSSASANGDAGTMAFDSGVVNTITEQQAEPGTQEMLTKGVLDGGYRDIQVEGVVPGPRTATVDVSVSGGNEPAARGRFVCVSKTDGPTTYWFVARFEKR